MTYNRNHRFQNPTPKEVFNDAVNLYNVDWNTDDISPEKKKELPSKVFVPGGIKDDDVYSWIELEFDCKVTEIYEDCIVIRGNVAY